MKDQSPWSGAHVRLKKLYEARVPDGMTQKEFGQKFGIGAQSMVAQYLNGDRPLNYDAAAKFAKALRCTIYDISPEMGDALQLEILPFLGKALRRAAALACFAFVPLLTPQPADAKEISALPPEQLCIMLRKALALLVRALAHLSVPFRRISVANA